MMIGGLLNACYVFCYVDPEPVLFYITAALSGLGGTFLWVSQGSDIVVNSTEKTINRNVSIFFGMYMCGTIGGNLYVFFAWDGIDIITEPEQLSIALIIVMVQNSNFIFRLLKFLIFVTNLA